MMKNFQRPVLIDINQTLRRPDGFDFRMLEVEGAYLRVEFEKITFAENSTEPVQWDTVFIWLNDQGREVLRQEKTVRAIPQPIVHIQHVRTRWQQFWFSAGQEFATWRQS